MMADENLSDDDEIPDTQRDQDLNDTYANFDDSDGDPGETREEYNSEEEKEQQQPVKPQSMMATTEKKKKTLTSKLFKGANKLKNKFM